MALSKNTVIDRIEILETGHIQVRRATYIEEDGVRVTDPRYSRRVYEPGDDVGVEHAKVRAIASVVWTPAVIAAHLARKAAQGA